MTDFKRSAQAEWKGDVQKGSGEIALQSGAFKGPYSFNSRFGDVKAANPEELIAAAHAGCFAMALSAALGSAGKPPESISAKSEVVISKKESGIDITGIELSVEAVVPGMDQAEFERIVADAAKNCPVSKALSAVKITHKAVLRQGASA
jgi:osmotically inducible protein OsmC